MNLTDQAQQNPTDRLEVLVQNTIRALEALDSVGNNKRNAHDYLTKAAQLAPDTFGIEQAIHELEYELEESEEDNGEILLQEALHNLQEAAKLAPEEPWIWFQIGWLSYNTTLGTSDDQTARTALERVLALDPENFHANLALAYLTGHWRKSDGDAEKSMRLMSGGKRARIAEPEVVSGPQAERWDDATD